MRVAFVTPYLPLPPDTGGKIRTFHLLRGLVRHHDVDLFSTYYGSAPDVNGAAGEICSRAHQILLQKDSPRRSGIGSLWEPLPKAVDHFQTSASLAEVRQLLVAGRYDLLVADEICMAPYVRGVTGPKVVARQKVDHMHYREVAAASAWGSAKVEGLIDAWKLRRYEHRFMSGFDAAVSCSDNDAAAMRALNPAVPITVVGNGVDLDFHKASSPVTGPPRLLYVGTMDYYPNIDAVQYFFQHIYDRLLELVPDLQVQVVGHNPPPEIRAWERLSGVTITGSVPDVRPYVTQCTALMVPLRLGGGTRLKIMEAIAAGRPVVSTSIGAEGLGLRDGEHLLLADEPIEFARRAAELLTQSQLRQRLVSAARPVVAERFSWRALGDRFEALCRSVAEQGAR